MARNGDDDEEDEASTEEHRISSTHCGQQSVPGSTGGQTIAFTINRLAMSLANPAKTHHCIETSLAISVRYDGFRAEAASTKQSVHNADSVYRQRLGGRQTHAQVRVFVGDYAGWLLAQRWCSKNIR